MRQWLFPAIFCLVCASPGYSQTKVIDVDKTDANVSNSLFFVVGGQPFAAAKYVRVVSGSPYFNENWMKGKVALGNGRMYDSMRLKLDLIDHSLLYLGKDNNELIATQPVKGVTLADSITRQQYHFIHSSFLSLDKNMFRGWYQILSSGKATLYKFIRKDIKENRPYGSATVEQSIETTDQYFLFYNSVFTRVKKIKDMPEILAGKKDEMKRYIDQQKLSGKSEEDYIKLVAYFNKLAETE
jgi:hypothetical protein